MQLLMAFWKLLLPLPRPAHLAASTKRTLNPYRYLDTIRRSVDYSEACPFLYLEPLVANPPATRYCSKPLTVWAPGNGKLVALPAGGSRVQRCRRDETAAGSGGG